MILISIVVVVVVVMRLTILFLFLQSFPKNSIIILTGQPLYQLFLELPNIVR